MRPTGVSPLCENRPQTSLRVSLRTVLTIHVGVKLEKSILVTAPVGTEGIVGQSVVVSEFRRAEEHAGSDSIHWPHRVGRAATILGRGSLARCCAGDARA